jgi:acetyltransferase-like isoleucine patch superfamily enzyme
MVYETEKSDSNGSENGSKQVIREEIKLQFHWYIFSLLCTYFLSFLLPGILLYAYLRFIFLPYFLLNQNFTLILTNPWSLLALASMPLIIIIFYLGNVFLIGLITRFFWRITEKISPTKEGVIPRNFNSKTLNFYNIRSFLIKYPKNAIIKGPFPWLINWLYNFIGANKVGKGTTIEEQFGADRFIEFGENSYIGVNSGFSSHSVEGIFGNISYFKIKIGDNVTTSALNCLAPGVQLNNNSYLLPLAGAVKHSKLKGENYYFGAPLRKIFKKKIKKYLNITDNDLIKDKALTQKQKELAEDS